MEMENQIDLEQMIKRIRLMEFYFDTIQNALMAAPESIREDNYVKMLEDLTRYYENGQWRQDYECDEQGMLPGDLKRGILSEDGIYNLLCCIEQEMD